MSLTETFDIEFPLFAFSHCRDVVAAVSRNGGFGVLGAVELTPEELRVELDWITAHTNGRPFGLDLIVPNKVEGRGEQISDEAMIARIPDEHREFAASVLNARGIDTSDLDERRKGQLTFHHNVSGDKTDAMLAVAAEYPIALLVNALGVPPPEMFDFARKHNIKVGALVGTVNHALNQARAGVDVLIAAGGEAGGHCGAVSTMVLIPEVCRALRKHDMDVPVLAAGGIATGEQMAAAMAMGAEGAWCGSVWLTTVEAETTPTVKAKMLQATASDTVRAKSRTGKPSRQLRSGWTDAWEADDAPAPLPMPLQGLVSEPALKKVDAAAAAGHEGAEALATYWVGQAVGLMNEERSVSDVMMEFKTEYLEAFQRIEGFLEGVAK
ncbi:MAG: nitronate monooxygenase [Proteobacteria bacterium]|nr:MAG: nitronate monooxygenase [Pseudomonadota bacterium]